MRGLLIKLSGARPDILERCPTERLKFQSLGWAILSSGILAAVSLWLGLASALGVNPILALPFALAWGLIIMGIERWLGVSLPSYGRRGWAIVVPRLLLTTLLGTLVAVPLVLQIFHPEINAKIASINQHTHHPASGLLVRLQALDKLSSESLTINVSRILLFLFFLMIESLPLIIRLMQKDGIYERILQAARERELTEARRAFRRAQSSVDRSWSPRDDFHSESLIEEIWRHPDAGPNWANRNVVQSLQPPLYQPEESDEHTRREDEALRGMEDIPAGADLAAQGGITLRYSDDDI